MGDNCEKRNGLSIRKIAKFAKADFARFRGLARWAALVCSFWVLIRSFAVEDDLKALGNFRVLGVVACAVALAGCKAEVAVDLFASDIRAFVTDGQKLDASAIVSLEASTPEKCLEVKDQMAKALLAGFAKAEFVDCRSADFTTWADFRVPVPLVGGNDPGTTALRLAIADVQGRVGIVLKQEEAKVAAVIEAMPDDIGSLVNGRLDVAVKAVFQNDLSTVQTVVAQGVFVDGEPYQLPHPTVLSRRDEIEIKLSDVGGAAIHSGGSLLFWLQDE